MEFELALSFRVTARVVVRDAALPMMRFPSGGEFEEFLEVGNGLWDATQLKVLAAAALIHVGEFGIDLQHLREICDRLGMFLLCFIDASAKIISLRTLGIGFDGLRGERERFGLVSVGERGLGFRE